MFDEVEIDYLLLLLFEVWKLVAARAQHGPCTRGVRSMDGPIEYPAHRAILKTLFPSLNCEIFGASVPYTAVR